MTEPMQSDAADEVDLKPCYQRLEIAITDILNLKEQAHPHA